MTEEDIINNRKREHYLYDESHKIANYNRSICASKDDVLKYYELVKNSNLPGPLIFLYIIFAYSKEEDYLNLLKEDLLNLPDVCVNYLKPIIQYGLDNFNKKTDRFYSDEYDIKCLNDVRTFESLFTSYIKKSSPLIELEYVLTGGMRKNFISAIYNKLNVDELAFCYYSLSRNALLFKNYSSEIDYENPSRNLIYNELNNRTNEELKSFIRTIILLPCQHIYGIEYCLVKLMNHYTHEELVWFLREVSQKYRCDSSLYINALKEAEIIKKHYPNDERCEYFEDYYKKYCSINSLNRCKKY